MKKAVSIILMVSIMIGLMSFSVFAEDDFEWEWVYKPEWCGEHDFGGGLALGYMTDEYGDCLIDVDGNVITLLEKIIPNTIVNSDDLFNTTTNGNSKVPVYNKEQVKFVDFATGTVEEKDYLCDCIYDYGNNCFVYEVDKKKGLLDSNGDIIIQAQYDEITSFYDGLACVVKGDKIGYINKDNTFVIPHIYSAYGTIINGIHDYWRYTGRLSNGLINICKDKKWGYINDKNEVILPFIYEQAQPFHKNYPVAVIAERSPEDINLYGLIDKSGNKIMDSKYYNILVSEAGLVFANDNWNYYRLYDINGKQKNNTAYRWKEIVELYYAGEKSYVLAEKTEGGFELTCFDNDGESRIIYSFDQEPQRMKLNNGAQMILYRYSNDESMSLIIDLLSENVKHINEDAINIGSYVFDKSGLIGLVNLKKLPALKSTVKITMQINNPVMNVNGEPKAIDEGIGTTPIIKDGRTLVPIRAIIEAMGGTVSWNAETSTVTLNYKENTMNLVIDSNTAFLNGQSKTLDVAPTVINGRTMLPIRFATENFGCSVDWDGEQQLITIIY